MSKRKRKRNSIWRKIVPFVVFLSGFLLVVFVSRELWIGWREDASARSEYAELRNIFELYIEPNVEFQPEFGVETQLKTDAEPDAEFHDEGYSYFPDIRDDSYSYTPVGSPDKVNIDMSQFTEINSDFVGWILITGTSVSYPVVQGQNNEIYLATTFSGDRNPAGAIFMDYRTTQAFDASITILHGHNMGDGSMFAPLLGYLDLTFRNDHPEIMIITACGEILIYEVFNARRARAWDRIYALDFNDIEMVATFENAPLGTERILLLSTCLSDGDRDARVLVYATLRTG